MSVICFYHGADLDGKCSAAIVAKAHPDSTLVPVDYGLEFPWHMIPNGAQVFMVDYALQPFSDMVKLAGMCDLTWIDHHQSAIESYKSALESGEIKPLAGLREIGSAGCELTWRYCMPGGGMSIPLGVQLLGRYDVWDQSVEDAYPFNLGMGVYESDPGKSGVWGDVLSGDPEFLRRTISMGRTIRDWKARADAQDVRGIAFPTELDGHPVLAANRIPCSSKFFDGVWDASKYHFMIAFGRKGGKWHVSLYTTRNDVDASVVAKAHGGGGHRQAAGFQASELPFLISS